MKVTKETVRQVAELSRLNLTAEEEEQFVQDMNTIVSYVNKLNDLSTEGIKPMECVRQINNVFREDEVKESLSREKILANAYSTEDGCFKVPRIV